MSGGLPADAITFVANSSNAGMVTETMPDGPVLVINTGTFTVYLGTVSSVGPVTGVPVEPESSLLWDAAGQLWAITEPDAGAVTCTIILTAHASQWTPDPAVVGAQIAARMVNAFAVANPPIQTFPTIADMNNAYPPAPDGTKAYVFAVQGFYSRIGQIWVQDSLDLGAPGGNPDLLTAVGSAYGNWTTVGLGAVATSLSASGGFLVQTFTSAGSTTVWARTRTSGIWTPWQYIGPFTPTVSRSAYVFTPSNNNGDITVSFGFSFPAVPVVLACSAQITIPTIAINNPVTTTGFAARAFNTNGTPAINTNIRLNWFATL